MRNPITILRLLMTLIKAHQRIATWHGETTILQKAMIEADRASVDVEAIEVVIEVEVVEPEETVHGVETAKGDEVMGSAAADAALKILMKMKMVNTTSKMQMEITEAIVAVADKEAAEAVPEVAPITEENTEVDVVNTVNQEVELAGAMLMSIMSQSTNQLTRLNSKKAANSINMSSISLMKKCEIMRTN